MTTCWSAVGVLIISIHETDRKHAARLQHTARIDCAGAGRIKQLLQLDAADCIAQGVQDEACGGMHVASGHDHKIG